MIKTTDAQFATGQAAALNDLTQNQGIAKDSEAGLTNLSNQINNAFVRTEELQNKTEKIQSDLNDQKTIVSGVQTIVIVGLIILIVAVGAMILSAVLFEIQTINQTNQQNVELLKAINDKTSK